jgi:hypothetical protein
MGEVARGSSKSSGSTRNRRDTAETQAPEDATLAPDAAEAPVTGADSPEQSAETLIDAAPDSPAPEDTMPADAPGEAVEGMDTTADSAAGSAGDDSVAAADDGIEDAEVVTLSTDGDETVTLSAEEPPQPAPTPPPPAAAAEPQRRGGLVPLILGGAIAAGIGYGVAYMGWLPTAPAGDDQIAEALSAQSQTLAALQAQVAELAAAPPEAIAAPEIDLTPITDQIGALATRIDGATETLGTLASRVTVLEDRPVFSGDIDADAAAALEAAAQLEAELEAQRAAAAEQAATLQAAAEAAATAAAEASAQAAAAIAEAEAEAQAALARAEAEAALVQVQVALETGGPFADALAALSDVTEVPETLSAVAATGVTTLDALQAGFPPLARAALPVALQETAGDNMGDRLGAFVMGQIGGRSVEPREGDDPDAVLSRVEAAVQAGDLRGALAELAALPQGAQAELSGWAADVEARAGAVEGLAALSAALTASGN